MDALYGVRMVGPLTPYARGFAEELTRLGFTTFSARAQLGLAVHLSRWLAAAGLDAMALTTATVDAFVAARRAAGYTAYLTPKALAPLLGYLRGLGVVPQPVVAAPTTPVEDLVERYRGYLLVERGLGVKVARGYVDLVRPFIAGRVRADGVELEELTAGEVTAFLVAQSRQLAPKTTQRLATVAIVAAVLARGGPDSRAAGPDGAQGRQPAGGACARAGASAGRGYAVGL